MKKKLLFNWLILISVTICGQDFKLNNPLPNDTAWIRGSLKNGIHYFIRSNKSIEKRADFYIVYNVGALQETEKQSGLAHFTEHLAFTSSSDCPKEMLENYFKNIGLKKGPDMNAFTSVNSTRYDLRRVPMTRKGILDSVMLFIKLNATCIALDSINIEKERKVILEEWRRGNNASKRISQKSGQRIFQGTPYARANIIGDTIVLKSFKHQELKDYYRKWYRPDHMFVVAVGDFDPILVENSIKKALEGVPPVPGQSPLTPISIPNNKEPMIVIEGDHEVQSSVVSIIYKHDPEIPKNLMWLKNRVIDELIVRMRQKRFFEQTHAKGSILANYSSSFLGAPEKWAYTITAGARNNKTLACLKNLLYENERAYRYGFTITEVEKGKASILRSEDSRLKDLDKKSNFEYFNECYEHIIYHKPLIDKRFVNNFVKKIIPSLTQDEIKSRFQDYMTRRNMVVSISGPQTNNLQLPSEIEVKNAINEVKTISMPPYVDLSDDKRLFNLAVEPGHVIESKTDSTFGTTEWNLSNGIKVILKSTDFNKNEIRILGESHGGLETIKDDDIPTANHFTKIEDMMGIGDMSNIELGEYLSGNSLNFKAVIGGDFNYIAGVSSPKDFETLMQIVHLYFAKPRFDEVAFDKFKNDEEDSYFNRASNPSQILSDSIQFIRKNRGSRGRPYNPDELSMDKFQKIYKEHFSDPANFTFFIVGNINSTDNKQIIEKYLGSLKSVSYKKEEYITSKPQGQTICDFNYPIETYKTSVHLEYTGELRSYTLKDLIYINLFSQVLEEECMKALRYDQQGVYAVEVSKFLSNNDKTLTLCIDFTCDPIQADKLKKLAKNEIENFLTIGPSDQSLKQSKEYLINVNKTLYRDNANWINLILTERYIQGQDFLSNFDTILKNTESHDLMLYIQNVFSKKNSIEITMRPK